jgi:large subunit ribosomal protein L18
MKVQKRRRRENKTDYLKRLKLLKSEKPRVVFRKTDKYIIAQYIVSKEAQDSIRIGITSKELTKHGWPENAKGSLKSITAAYLTGYLFGKKILSKKLENPIMDFGMIPALHKSKVYAFLKGFIDSGIKINCKEGIFPEENRIKGEHLKNKIDFQKIKSNIEKVK